jgi:hypothetical protein
MALADVIRAGVAGVQAQLTSLQVTVTHEAWIGHADAYGGPDYAPPVSLSALVQEGTNQRRLPTGEVITARACVSFLQPVPANGAVGRREPIDPRDRVTLPSGITGPLVENPGAMVDPSTGRPYLSVFWLQ